WLGESRLDGYGKRDGAEVLGLGALDGGGENHPDGVAVHDQKRLGKHHGLVLADDELHRPASTRCRAPDHPATPRIPAGHDRSSGTSSAATSGSGHSLTPT